MTNQDYNPEIYKASRTVFYFIFLFILLLIFFSLDLFSGSVKIPAGDIIRLLFSGVTEKDEWRTIVIDFRLPRSFTAVLAGIGLSLSGLQMQSVFRNPLAGPYVLGISAGASLGVALLVMGASSFDFWVLAGSFNHWAIVISAWLGSGLVLLMILAVSFRIRDVLTILILGILFGSITIALVSILQYFSDESMLKTFIVWTLGSLGNVSGSQMTIMSICIFAGILISLFAIKPLNILLLGENYARTLGINIWFARSIIFTSTSILAGTITAFCGPIGFIGIAVPHLSRLIFKTSEHKILMPGTMLIGAIVLIISDIISHLPGSDKMLPINSVTAMLGVPIVVWIILRNQKFAKV